MIILVIHVNAPCVHTQEKWSTKLQDLQQKLELEKKEAVQQEQANTVTLSEELKQLKEVS